MAYDKERAQAERYKIGPRPGTRFQAPDGERLVIDTVIREDNGKVLVVYEEVATGNVKALPVLHWKRIARFAPLQSAHWTHRPRPGSLWCHFKGGTYLILTNAVDVAGHHLVIYRSEQTQGVWARLAPDWFEQVDRPECNYKGQRFSLAS